MLPEEPQMHNCKKSGSRSKRESTIGTTKTMPQKNNNTQIKLLLLPKWDKFLKTNLLWKRSKWWKKCNNTIRCLLKRKEIENPNGLITNSLRMQLKLTEPIWVISCKRISQQQNLNLPHTDLYHITSRDLEQNKSKISLPKEINKLLTPSWQERTNNQRNTHGLSKIYQIPNINWITKLILKIDKNKLLVTNVILT